MSTINFSTPNFESFDDPSLKEWKLRIEKELKGKEYAQEMVYHLPGGLTAEAANAKDNLQLTPDLIRPSNESWKIQQTFTLTGDIENLNKLLLNQLVNGVEAIVLKVPYSESFIQQQVKDYYADISTLLKGVVPSYIDIQFAGGFQSPYLLEAYTRWLTENGHPSNALNGAFLWDPYAMAMWCGNWEQEDIQLAQDFAKTLKEQLPNYRWVSSNAYLYNACGATGVQELAFGICNLLSLENPTLPAIRLASNRNFLTELAKIRSVHTLWKRLATKYKPAVKDTTLHIYTTTSLWNQALVDPYNNLVRTTLQAMSAINGGAHYVEVQSFNKFDEPHDPFGYRLAKNIQLLLKEESYLDRVADPAGGAYALENLTTATINAVEELANEVMQSGGMPGWIQEGKIQAAINENRAKITTAFEQKDLVQIGVNKHRGNTDMDSPPPAAFSTIVGEPNIATITPLRLK